MKLHLFVYCNKCDSCGNKYSINIQIQYTVDGNYINTLKHNLTLMTAHLFYSEEDPQETIYSFKLNKCEIKTYESWQSLLQNTVYLI